MSNVTLWRFCRCFDSFFHSHAVSFFIPGKKVVILSLRDALLGNFGKALFNNSDFFSEHSDSGSQCTSKHQLAIITPRWTKGNKHPTPQLTREKVWEWGNRERMTPIIAENPPPPQLKTSAGCLKWMWECSRKLIEAHLSV